MRIELVNRTCVIAGRGGALVAAIGAALQQNGATVRNLEDIGPSTVAADIGDVLVIDACLMSVDPAEVDGVCRAFAGAVGPERAGRIVILVSALGLVPARGERRRSADSAAIISLTRALAMDVAQQGVAVNAIALGSIDDVTPANRMISHVPLGRSGSVEDVVNAVLFLADPANSYMTGHVLAVDGGWVAGYARDF